MRGESPARDCDYRPRGCEIARLKKENLDAEVEALAKELRVDEDQEEEREA